MRSLVTGLTYVFRHFTLWQQSFHIFPAVCTLATWFPYLFVPCSNSQYSISFNSPVTLFQLDYSSSGDRQIRQIQCNPIHIVQRGGGGHKCNSLRPTWLVRRFCIFANKIMQIWRDGGSRFCDIYCCLDICCCLDIYCCLDICCCLDIYCCLDIFCCLDIYYRLDILCCLDIYCTLDIYC